MKQFDPNQLFFDIVKIFKENYEPDHKVTICNEGGSRSSKTWDFLHFLILYCDHNRDSNQEIYVLRNKLVDCRDFTYKEFEKVLKLTGCWDDSKKKESPKPYYNLFGNHIFFRGLDEDKEAPPSDIIFVNEALEIDTRAKLKGWFMRCRKLQVLDWNPKYTQHWCFDMEGQPNVFFTHTNYKNNKYLQKSIVEEIESYCPWHFDDLHLPEKQRRPHPTNISNGTADKYQWEVYGEGKRSAPEGVIFKNIRYIDEWPANLGYHYGMDFGFTADPTSLVKYAETETDIYCELLCYQPTETPEEIDSFADSIGLNKELSTTADSSDRYVSEKNGAIRMVRSLKLFGWNIHKVSKTKTIMFWLLSMKKKRINIVNNNLVHFAKKEAENYTLKTVNGIAINQPVDNFNHFWDAVRYAHMAEHSNANNFVVKTN